MPRGKHLGKAPANVKQPMDRDLRGGFLVLGPTGCKPAARKRGLPSLALVPSTGLCAGRVLAEGRLIGEYAKARYRTLDRMRVRALPSVTPALPDRRQPENQPQGSVVLRVPREFHAVEREAEHLPTPGIVELNELR